MKWLYSICIAPWPKECVYIVYSIYVICTYCRYYADLTTCTPEGEALYNNDGTVVMNKLQVLSRTYPMVAAGSVSSYKFRPKSAYFDMVYDPMVAPSGADTDGALENQYSTIVYYNHEEHYPYGVQVEVMVDEAASMEVTIQCALDRYVVLQAIATTDGDMQSTVHVQLRPCKAIGKCTCKTLNY